MKDYSNMSDFEINKLIAIELSPNGYIGINESTRSDSEVVITTENGEGCTKNSYIDYCNSPSDAWPLIESNLICLMADVFCEPQDGGKWIAQPAYGWQHERVRNDNPLRAAMIVYLMMKDEEK